jgi:hypothetical protein
MKIHLALSVHTYRLNYFTNTHKIWYCTRADVYFGAFFQKTGTERVFSNSLKIGTAYKTRMRCQLFEVTVCRLPQMQATTSERVLRQEGRRSDDSNAVY